MARIIPLHNLPVFSIVDPPDPSFSFDQGAAFLINKPKGRTSHDMVEKIRQCIDLRKVGHAGTLDPKATGLLILCCGKGTRTVSEIQELPKTYRAEVTFGAATRSYDTETEVTKTASFEHITEVAVTEMLNEHFTGTIEQTPPMYSALKHKGQPLYKLARQNKEVKRKSREVEIYASRIISFNLPQIELLIRCGTGTYIRSVAHELGLALDSAAHLSALERTAIGHFKNENALTVEDLDLIFSRES